jgi:hypothetical protein
MPGNDFLFQPVRAGTHTASQLMNIGNLVKVKNCTSAGALYVSTSISTNTHVTEI